MNAVQGGLIHDLAAEHRRPCVTLYLPTGPWDADGRQIRIRWKNLLRKVAGLLEAEGLAKAQIEALLAPTCDLDPAKVLQGTDGEGLAVFVSAGFFRAHVLPTEPKEEVVVGAHFHVRPLVEALAEPPRFHVLAFSQNHVRLLAATTHHAVEIPLPGCPPTLAEALKYDEHERSVQSHGGPAEGGGRLGAIFHGEGGASQPHKDEILRFARQVVFHVQKALGEHRGPLVLACVEYLAPILREVGGLPHLTAEFVRGNPERIRADELAARAWEIVREELERGTAADAGRFRALAGTGRTAGSIEEVLPAAASGRVETLFLAADRQAWGRFEEATGRVTLHAAPQPGDQDLLDAAALAVLERGAVVHVVPRDAMPAPSMAAAILRS